jgi:hypothetical protein
MTRLIVTTSASGSGHLKQSGIADKVIAVWHRLTSRPIPIAGDRADFFVARLATVDADPRTRDALDAWERETYMDDRQWRDLLPTCRKFDRVELWIDPDPNAQLLLVQLLDWFGTDLELVAKTVVLHADTPLAECPVDDLRTLQPTFDKVDVPGLDLAARAWNAYRQPTPKGWFDLLDSDSEALPHLRRTVRLLLDELPATRTALMASERRFLDLLANGATTTRELFEFNAKDSARVFDYWEAGRLIDGLARCPTPAILGLEVGPFDLAMHDDCARHRRYSDSRLSLSELGHALLEGRDDFSRHNPIHRWWGGTWLTNESLWRWDAGSSSLVDPRSIA